MISYDYYIEIFYLAIILLYSLFSKPLVATKTKMYMYTHICERGREINKKGYTSAPGTIIVYFSIAIFVWNITSTTVSFINNSGGCFSSSSSFVVVC